jgi:hypothetical protein
MKIKKTKPCKHLWIPLATALWNKHSMEWNVFAMCQKCCEKRYV